MRKDHLTGNLFGEKPPQKGEEGYLEPGYTPLNKPDEVVDKKGDVRNRFSGQLIREAPSPEYAEALKVVEEHHPEIKDEGVRRDMARDVYLPRIKARKERGAKNQKKQK